MTILPIPHEPTRFVVASTSRKDVSFVVDLDYAEQPGQRGRPACGCEQFMARGIECKHIRAVQAALARRLTQAIH